MAFCNWYALTQEGRPPEHVVYLGDRCAWRRPGPRLPSAMEWEHLSGRQDLVGQVVWGPVGAFSTTYRRQFSSTARGGVPTVGDPLATLPFGNPRVLGKPDGNDPHHVGSADEPTPECGVRLVWSEPS